MPEQTKQLSPNSESQPARHRAGDQLTIEVTSIAAGGDAFGRSPETGVAVFADAGLPGDHVTGRIAKAKKGFVRLAVASVVRGPDAIESECGIADECGGCRFWRATYEDELRWKADAVTGAVERIGRTLVWPVPTIIPAQSVTGYRERARFRVDADGRTGFVRARSKDVVSGACLVLHPNIEAARSRAENLFAGVEGLRSIFMEWDAEQHGVAVTGEFTERDIPDVLRSVRAKVERSKPLDDITTVVVTARRRRNVIVGDGNVWRRRSTGEGSVVVKDPSASFSQANSAMNEVLIRTVLAGLSESHSPREILELCSGSGNFTFPLLGLGVSVDAVDIADGPIQAAAAMWDSAPGTRARFHVADLEDGLPAPVRDRLTRFDTIVADPARGGLSAKLCDDLCRASSVQRFVYVSCDPPSMARDVQRLATVGFRPTSWSLIDMFPRTPHLEAVVELRR